MHKSPATTPKQPHSHEGQKTFTLSRHQPSVTLSLTRQLVHRWPAIFFHSRLQFISIFNLLEMWHIMPVPAHE